MLITCEDCDSRFQLDDSRMKEEGVKVKCSKCGKVFMAYAPSSVEMTEENATGIQGFGEESPETEENGLDFSEMEAMLSEGEDSGFDIASDEADDIIDSGFGFDETDELDLTDMDKIIAEDETPKAESIAGLENEELDFDLDEVQDTVPSLGSTKEGSEEIEELDFLEEGDEEAISSVEDIEELDLELDEATDIDISEVEEAADLSIDGEDLGFEVDKKPESPEMVEELGISDSEMDEVFAVDEQGDSGAFEETEGLEEELEVEDIPDEDEEELEIDGILDAVEPEEEASEEVSDEFEELGLTDIKEMFTLEEGQEAESIESEEVSDFDLDMGELDSSASSLDDVSLETTEVSGSEAEMEGSEDEEDEFEEFGLTDLEEMFNLEAEKKPEEPEPADESPSDFDFDDDIAGDDSEELEFKLDEAIAVLNGSSQEEIGVEFEEYEELDLSELDEMFEKEEVVEAKETAPADELGDLDFDMDALPETEADVSEVEEEEDLGIADTSELDFSDIGEMLESEGEQEPKLEEELQLPDTPDIEEDESGLDFGLETQTLAEDDDGLDFGSEAQDLAEESPLEDKLPETVEEMESDGLSDDNLDLSDDDFDLSDMEKLFDETDSLEAEAGLDEIVSPASAPPGAEEKEAPLDMEDDLDFGLDAEDTAEQFFQTEETQDIELEFGIEEETEEAEDVAPPPEQPPEVTETAKADGDDIEATYDMGLELDEIRKKQAADKIRGVKVEEKTETIKKATATRKGKPIPFEKKKKTTPVLVAVLLIFLIIGVPIALTNMGIEIPYASDYIRDLGIKIPYTDVLAEKIKQANIPYISDLITSGDQDTQGISNITILEPSISGYYVENKSIGDIFVISGQVRNDYDQLRNFIRIKGQIYSKGRAKTESKTVYAGNVFSEEGLSSSSAAEIDKKLNNKYGDKQSNFKLNKGKTVPFIIVFTKVPENLDGYDVEVVSSTIYQANDENN